MLSLSVADSLTRRELLRSFGQLALLSPVSIFAAAINSPTSRSARPSKPRGLSDDAFLDEIERASFRFFWEQASPVTGQIKDRALAAGNDTRTVSSIAATGFGLAALSIGHKRAYADRGEIRSRVATTLDFLANRQTHEKGFFYHFIDMNSGARVWNCELSSIDTAILLCGVLTCRQYFEDTEIQKLATQIYNRVDWSWMLNGDKAFSMGWTPEQKFIPSRWDTYSELMMLYLLAIGATKHSIPSSSWDAFTRPSFTYQSLTYITNKNAPLFIHQFSHAFFDFRQRNDRYTNYFDNSVTATRAHKLFCLSLQKRFRHYQPNLWGITASDSAKGYFAWGGPPAMGTIDGTIVPCASGGSLPFAPRDCIAVLRNIRKQYPRTWQRYGYIDAFNPATKWYDPDVIGIDVGITMLMAENLRTGFVWDTFMKNPEAQKAMDTVFV